MNTLSEAFAAIDAQRQAREQEARARAAEIEPGPEEQALNQVLARDTPGWGPEAIAAQRVRAGFERSQRERWARQGNGE